MPPFHLLLYVNSLWCYLKFIHHLRYKLHSILFKNTNPIILSFLLHHQFLSVQSFPLTHKQSLSYLQRKSQFTSSTSYHSIYLCLSVATPLQSCLFSLSLIPFSPFSFNITQTLQIWLVLTSLLINPMTIFQSSSFFFSVLILNDLPETLNRLDHSFFHLASKMLYSCFPLTLHVVLLYLLCWLLLFAQAL